MHNEEDEEERDKAFEKLVESSILPLNVPNLSTSVRGMSYGMYQFRQEDYHELLHEGLMRDAEQQSQEQSASNLISTVIWDATTERNEPPTLEVEDQLQPSTQIVASPEHKKPKVTYPQQEVTKKKAKRKKTKRKEEGAEKQLIYGGKPHRRSRKGPEDEFQTMFTFK